MNTSSKPLIVRYWPLLTALAVLWVLLGIVLKISTDLNAGSFIYALDDAYIHLAMAKHFAADGVWGVTRYEFASCSSSPLWTLLLSFFNMFADDIPAVPFALNALFNSLTLVALYSILRSNSQSIAPGHLAAFLTAAVFAAPMGALVFGGLEHSMHICFTVLFVYHAANNLAGQSGKFSARDSAPLLLLGPLMSFTRYEGLFLVLIVCALLLAKRRFRLAFLLASISAAPVLAYGLLSISKGWYVLPNSLMLKGQFPDITTLKGVAVLLGARLFTSPPLLLLVALSAIFYFERHTAGVSFWDKSQVLMFLFVTSTIAHMQFARTGWLFRYEAYLIVTGMMVLTIAVHNLYFESERRSFASGLMFTRRGTILLAALFALCFSLRVVNGIGMIPPATKNIHDQQYQAGLFLGKYYTGRPVAANDIGAANYLADIRCFDTFGLGTMDVARARRNGTYGSRVLDSLTTLHGIKIAMVYESWLQIPRGGVFSETAGKGVPARWQKVGSWILQNNVIAANDTLSIFAVDESEKAPLVSHLREFSRDLPRDVIQTGKYTAAMGPGDVK